MIIRKMYAIIKKGEYEMSDIIVDFSKKLGPIKPMHCVNNGPSISKKEQIRSNFSNYKELGIPYVRNHDASLCSNYGGEHIVDVHAIFPDFDKDVNDPESYDFFLTDRYIKSIMDAGSEVFYRLGTKIEHAPKKYGTVVPKDFEKWAQICEHIIMHYNEGWANGYKWNITYWEIWNEPDGAPNWTGTMEQYHELYKITATHLKNRFPNIKIGGPAMTSGINVPQVNFFKYLKNSEEDIPMDFYSWHDYTISPKEISKTANIVRERLDKAGYTKAENILDEWNYVENWTTKWVDSLKVITSLKGAAFVAACMCEGQNSALDMLMYYDARINCTMNGMFDFYTLLPLKGYYPFKIFNELYIRQNQVEAKCLEDDIYIVAARADNGEHKGKGAAMLCYYDENDTGVEKTLTFSIKGALNNAFNVFIVDEKRDLLKVDLWDFSKGEIEISLKPNDIIMLMQ